MKNLENILAMKTNIENHNFEMIEVEFGIMRKLIGLITLVAITACGDSSRDVHRLDLKDSLAVTNFIKKEQTCDKIFYVEKNKQKFVEEVGFSRLILLDLSKQMAFKFFIPYASGGMIQSTRRKMIVLQEQLDTVKVKAMCY